SIAYRPSGSVAFLVGEGTELFRKSKRPATISDIQAVDVPSPHHPQLIIAFVEPFREPEGFRPENVCLGQRTSYVRQRCCQRREELHLVAFAAVRLGHMGFCALLLATLATLL